jgi:hypothetical protein
MADETQGVETQVNDTPAPATPTGEQKTTGSEQVPNELPNEASDRTKERFETLTRELKEERQRREALEGAFNTLKPKEVKPEQVLPIVDPDTGLLNEQALVTTQQRAIEAERQAQETKRQLDGLLEGQKKQAQEREDQEAFTAHPELNPKNEKFNKDLRDITASLMLQSMVHPEDFGNKQLSHKEAGDKAKELIAKISGNVKEEAAKEAIEQLSPKEQAALEATGSRQRSNLTDLESLQRRTRKGDPEAIMERLARMQSS